jgi:hypothetical protein
VYEGKEAQWGGNDDVHSTQRVLEGKRKEGGRKMGCRPCEKGVEKMLDEKVNCVGMDRERRGEVR